MVHLYKLEKVTISTRAKPLCLQTFNPDPFQKLHTSVYTFQDKYAHRQSPGRTRGGPSEVLWVDLAHSTQASVEEFSTSRTPQSVVPACGSSCLANTILRSTTQVFFFQRHAQTSELWPHFSPLLLETLLAKPWHSFLTLLRFPSPRSSQIQTLPTPQFFYAFIFETGFHVLQAGLKLTV